MTETTFSSDLSHADVDVVGAGNLREGPETTKSVWSASQRALDGLGRSAVTQIVHAAKSASDGVIEVRLSPEELGRVRFSMTAGDAGMVVQIAAERPETLELLRRNIDLLAADLKQQGFSNLDFAFGQDRQTSQTFDEHPDGHESSVPVSQSDVIPGVDQGLIRKAVSDGRLDIRL